MDGFMIVMDKELASVDLLLQNEPSLPEAMRQLNLCDAFVGLAGDRAIAVCLLAKRKGYYDVVNLAVDARYEDTDACHELLMYVLDYVRVQGGVFVEAGAGNAHTRRHGMFMRLGFRVVGVWADHFLEKTGRQTLENGILNRDMIRYRINLREMVTEEDGGN